MIKVSIDAIYYADKRLHYVKKTIKFLGIRVYTKRVMPYRRVEDQEGFEFTVGS